VNVGIGAINPQMQLQRFVAAVRLLSEILGTDFLNRPLSPAEREIVKEVFGKSGYKDGSRFLAPEQEEEEEDPRLLQAMQVIEQLQQALAAKHPPEVVAAQVEKLLAEASLKKVEATTKRVEALYSAMNTAQTAVTTPGVTPVADAIAKSAGFEDQNAGTIYPPAGPAQAIAPASRIPANTSPLLPANPQRGMRSGLESGPAVQQFSEQVPA
jgi:hypothetical protein